MAYQKRWYIDTEANSLVPDRFWCAVCKALDDPSVIEVFEPSSIHLLPKFISESKLIVGHNFVAWDAVHLQRVFDFKIAREKVRDSLLMSRLANSRRGYDESEGCNPVLVRAPHSIEAWGVRFGKAKPVMEQWKVYDDTFIPRCLADVEIGYLALKKILLELKGVSKDAIDVEHDLAWLLSDMEQRGFFLDVRKTFELFTKAKDLADGFQADIRRVFPMKSELVREVEPKVTKTGAFNRAQIKCLGPEWEDKVGGPFSLFDWCEFNVDSPKMRVERLMSVGWKPSQFTKPSKTHPDGQPKFDAEDLERDDLKTMPKEARLIGKYLLCRSRQRLASQWLDLEKGGYVHGQVGGLTAWSHRATHKNPNMANIPSIVVDEEKKPILGLDGMFGFECRDVWTVDEPGQVLLDADLTAIQLRGFAHYVAESEYISLVCDPSVDMHSVHAGYLGNVPRPAAKRWLYAFLLGAGAKKLGSLLGGSAQTGKDAAELFMSKVPGVKKLKDTVIPKWTRQGYLVGLDGRRVPVPSNHLGLAAALQSFEKVVVAHAMVRLEKWNAEMEFDLKFRSWIHDEIVCSVDEKWVDKCGDKFVEFVRQVGLDFKSLAPLTAAWSKGKTWATGQH